MSSKAMPPHAGQPALYAPQPLKYATVADFFKMVYVVDSFINLPEAIGSYGRIKSANLASLYAVLYSFIPRAFLVNKFTTCNNSAIHRQKCQ
jgi:hypothetical protein